MRTYAIFSQTSAFHEVEFYDLLKEDIGFIVISKEALKGSKLYLHELRISLLRNAIFPFDVGLKQSSLEDAAHIALAEAHTDSTKNIYVHMLPEACKDVGPLLYSVLSMAHDEFSGIGGFLYLYQVAEHLMEMNFASLVQEASCQGLPAWKLK